MSAVVTELALTAVKGTRLHSVASVELGPLGAAGDRRFFVIDADARMQNSKRLGNLSAVVADWSAGERVLTLTFPDGSQVSDVVSHDGTVMTKFFSLDLEAPLVSGPFADALSEFFGHPLRLVETDRGVDRGTVGGAVSLISRGSLERLAEIAETDSVDGRRFRMLIEVEGVEPHAEDRWVGSAFRIGEAEVRFKGHVGRCLVTNRNPDTGAVDFPTLVVLARYRLGLETTEPLPFGIYGEVLRGGRVAVGDPVEPL